jgi:hypothetical protein
MAADHLLMVGFPESPLLVKARAFCVLKWKIIVREHFHIGSWKQL